MFVHVELWIWKTIGVGEEERKKKEKGGGGAAAAGNKNFTHLFRDGSPLEVNLYTYIKACLSLDAFPVWWILAPGLGEGGVLSKGEQRVPSRGRRADVLRAVFPAQLRPSNVPRGPGAGPDGASVLL